MLLCLIAFIIAFNCLVMSCCVRDRRNWSLRNWMGTAIRLGGQWWRPVDPPYTFCILNRLNLGGHSKFRVSICPPKTPLVAPMVLGMFLHDFSYQFGVSIESRVSGAMGVYWSVPIRDVHCTPEYIFPHHKMTERIITDHSWIPKHQQCHFFDLAFIRSNTVVFGSLKKPNVGGRICHDKPTPKVFRYTNLSKCSYLIMGHVLNIPLILKKYSLVNWDGNEDVNIKSMSFL